MAQYRVISFCPSGAVNIQGRGSYSTLQAAEEAHDRLHERFIHSAFDIQWRKEPNQPWQFV